MDNNEFDKIIRDKVNAYKGSEPDPHAIDDLHTRLDGVVTTPWYEPYRKPAQYAAGIALISLINFGLFWWWHSDHEAALSDQIQQLAVLQTEYIQAAEKNQPVGTSGVSKIDTVYLAQPAFYSENYKTIVRENELLKKRLALLEESRQEDITWGIRQFLTQYKLAPLDKDGNILLQYDEEMAFLLDHKGYVDLAPYMNPDFNPESVELYSEKEVNKKPTLLSAKVLRNIEKHYMRGVGLRWGPEVDLFASNPEIGNSKPGIGIGTMVEFILSPSIRVESGLKYSHSGYRIDNGISPELIASYPSTNNDISSLEEINVNTQSVNIPLHLKYMHPLTRENALFASAGFTTQYFAKQVFRYSYLYELSGTESEHFSVDIEAKRQEEGGEFYLGTLDMSLGVERKLKNGNYLLLSAFYNHGLSDIGLEQRKIGILGLRSSIRFNLN